MAGESSAGNSVQTDVKSHHRVNTYNPSLDRMVAELEQRFNIRRFNQIGTVDFFNDNPEHAGLKTEMFIQWTNQYWRLTRNV